MKQHFAPPGHSTVSPYLLVTSASDTLAFLTHTFEAVELQRVTGKDGSIQHAEVRIGDSVIMMGERPSACLPASTHVYVPNVDETYSRALAAGAESLSEPRDLPYGDRSAGVRDPQGNLWWLGTHLRGA
ncbi:VOC family protein [Marinobacter sp. C2H3]|uniref:VOC family protein n=1 Tax=Marinobacter sp. C2H3 TaxID=3119003 RepID=UPI00300EA510